MEHPLNISMLFPADIGHTYWHVMMTFLVMLFTLFLGSIASRQGSEIPGRTQALSRWLWAQFTTWALNSWARKENPTYPSFSV
ncbi:MAG: hypothetical protein LRY51_13700 [Geovibrio sp.]|nr:hypothetical protein [Geovibrio sp.]